MNKRIAPPLALASVVALAACGGGGVEVSVVAPFRPQARNTDFVAGAPIGFSVASTGRTRFVLAGVNGAVVVAGAPAGGGVTIRGERRVGSDSLADAQAHLPLLQVEAREVGTEIHVRTVQPQDSAGRSYVVDYQVRVPAAFELNIAGVNGSIDLSGMTGNVRTSLVNGNTKAALRVPPGGSVEIVAVNGDIDLHLPLDTSAELLAQVAIGTIAAQDLIVHKEVRSSTMLQGTLGNGGASVNLQTNIGSVRIDGSS